MQEFKYQSAIISYPFQRFCTLRLFKGIIDRVNRSIEKGEWKKREE
jgi:hypothetical protein